jgi:hypothetical protein
MCPDKCGQLQVDDCNENGIEFLNKYPMQNPDIVLVVQGTVGFVTSFERSRQNNDETSAESERFGRSSRKESNMATTGTCLEPEIGVRLRVASANLVIQPRNPRTGLIQTTIVTWPALSCVILLLLLHDQYITEVREICPIHASSVSIQSLIWVRQRIFTLPQCPAPSEPITNVDLCHDNRDNAHCFVLSHHVREKRLSRASFPSIRLQAA